MTEFTQGTRIFPPREKDSSKNKRDRELEPDRVSSVSNSGTTWC